MLNFLKSLFAPGPPVPDEFRSPSPDDPDYHGKLAEFALKEMKAYRGNAGILEPLFQKVILERSMEKQR